MNKKISPKKAEKILNIQEEEKCFDILQQPNSQQINHIQEEQRIKYEQRKKEVEKIQKSIEALKNENDEEFIKKTLKELTTIGMCTLHQMQEEMLVDPSGRMGECMASLTNSIVAALKQISDMENDKQKISIEKEKLEVKKQVIQQTKNLSTTNNVVVIGSISEALKLIKDQQQEYQQKELQVSVNESETIQNIEQKPEEHNNT